jgi:hypothetical protein
MPEFAWWIIGIIAFLAFCWGLNRLLRAAQADTRTRGEGHTDSIGHRGTPGAGM